MHQRLVAIVFALAGMLPPASAQEAVAPAPTGDTLQARLEALARRAGPATFGIEVLDPIAGTTWRVNANRAFAMMSVFKAPIAAAVLAQVDAGRLSLQQDVTIERGDLREGSAVPSIGDHFTGDRMNFTLERLLVAMVGESDNTAADALLKLAGGPASVTGFLRSHGIDGMRVDMGEGEVAEVFSGLPNGQAKPANETRDQERARRQRGYRAFLDDPRNRSTPDAAIAFLRKLRYGELLSPASTRRLLDLMEAQTVPDRLRAGLPHGVHLADKCGTSASFDGATAAHNDIGILTWPDGHQVMVAAFLADSHASKEERDALFVDLGREVSAAFARQGRATR